VPEINVQLNLRRQLRITNIVDAIGQPTALLYTNAAYSNAITGVIDPSAGRRISGTILQDAYAKSTTFWG